MCLFQGNSSATSVLYPTPEDVGNVLRFLFQHDTEAIALYCKQRGGYTIPAESVLYVEDIKKTASDPMSQRTHMVIGVRPKGKTRIGYISMEFLYEAYGKDPFDPNPNHGFPAIRK